MKIAKKIAFVTQSYKNDFFECKLLCESLDRFAPEYDHFIFVNDEDFKLFKSLKYGRHYIFKKSRILPWYLFRLPIKLAGHYFHVSPFTIPVREWIIQQICKLGVFEVVGAEYGAVFNIDSETVVMKPFEIGKMINDSGKYMLFRDSKEDEPSKKDYYVTVKKFLSISDADMPCISKWNYMNTPVCFERENLKALLKEIDKNTFFGGWKRVLCNTYRFSEYYTYGVFADFCLKQKNHFLTDVHFFPQIDMRWCKNLDEFNNMMEEKLADTNALGLWLQKGARKSDSDEYLNMKDVRDLIYSYWKKAV